MNLSPQHEEDIRRIVSEKQQLREQRIEELQRSLAGIRELIELVGNSPEDKDWKDVDEMCQVKVG